MNILHILRSDPIPMINIFIHGISESSEYKYFNLNQENIDYDKLVEEIFYSDRVICWW